MNFESPAEGRDALKMHAEMNGILNKANYTAADKEEVRLRAKRRLRSGLRLRHPLRQREGVTRRISGTG
jgi:hypothetical protein